MKKPAAALLSAADILDDVGNALYGSEAQAGLASMLGVPGRVIRDTLRDHGGLSVARIVTLAEERVVEATRLRDAIRARMPAPAAAQAAGALKSGSGAGVAKARKTTPRHS